MGRNKHIYRGLIVLFLVIAIFFSGSPGLNARMDQLGVNRLYESNHTYIESALNRSLATFALLSGIKIGLAIMEGSHLGVGFSIEVGDAVQAAYDYVDVAWRTVLAGSAILMGTQYLLKMAQMLDNRFLSFALICFVFKLCLQWFIRRGMPLQRIFGDLGWLMAMIAVSLFLVLPLSIWGGSRLSDAITSSSLKEADAGIAEVRQNLFPDNELLDDGLLGQLQKAKTRLQQLGAAVTAQTRELSLYLLKIIAGYLFDTLIFPLTLFVLFYSLMRLGGQYLFNLQRERTQKADLEAIAAKYFGKAASP